MKTYALLSLTLLFSCSSALSMYKCPDVPGTSIDVKISSNFDYLERSPAAQTKVARAYPNMGLRRKDRIARENLIKEIAQLQSAGDTKQDSQTIKQILTILENTKSNYSLVNQKWINEQITTLYTELAQAETLVATKSTTLTPVVDNRQKETVLVENQDKIAKLALELTLANASLASTLPLPASPRETLTTDIPQLEAPLQEFLEVEKPIADLSQTMVLENNLFLKFQETRNLESELEKTRKKAEELESKLAQAQEAKKHNALELFERSEAKAEAQKLQAKKHYTARVSAQLSQIELAYEKAAKIMEKQTKEELESFHVLGVDTTEVSATLPEKPIAEAANGSCCIQ
ncbi:hypothetical protein H0X48_05635 [Candidatus Dependentiae bacterium]|nr:hypothetical protein [Candidatus Dependentiae bacterium]